MPNLMCNVSNCVHNAANACCKEGIDVSGTQAMSSSATSCSSFQERTGAFTSSHQHPNAILNVDCAATNCTYNASGVCGAESISIAGGMSSCSCDTECSSFVPKY